jgi:cytochrome b6-f complex iron-sulfur subunit
MARLVPEPSRRQVLRAGLAAGALGAAAWAVCPGCALFVHVEAPDAVLAPTDGLLRLPRELSQRLLASGGSAYVQPQGRDNKLVVFGPPGGPLHALSSVCSHRGCDVEYQPQVGHIVCPCHGSEYATDGGVLKGPADAPLRRYDVRVEHGEVVIAL